MSTKIERTGSVGQLFHWEWQGGTVKESALGRSRFGFANILVAHSRSIVQLFASMCYHGRAYFFPNRNSMATVSIGKSEQAHLSVRLPQTGKSRQGKTCDNEELKRKRPQLSIRHLGMGALAMLLSILSIFSVKGQVSELPLVRNFIRADYSAQKQNWDIDQLSTGLLCVANTSGLLTFDGSHWTTYHLPQHKILRTIKVHHDTIYAGAFGEFGYWFLDTNEGSLKYNSLTAGDTSLGIEQEEIWNIIEHNGKIYCQSFGNIFLVGEHGLKRIEPPSSIRFIHKIDKDLILQVRDLGLYQIIDSVVAPLVNTNQWDDRKIVGVVGLDNQNWLVATENQGFFLSDGQQEGVFSTEIDASLHDEQINKLAFLSNGQLAIGTITNGLYILDLTGKLVAHFTKENGLANNTILSLFEDKGGNLWAGLDDGLAMVQLTSPLRYWQDFDGTIGTPFTAMMFADRLYIGSNQGLYYRDMMAKPSSYQLVRGSQGQVWDLIKVGAKIFVAHNNGLYQLVGDSLSLISDFAGVYTAKVWKETPLTLLVGTYTGLTSVTFEESSGAYTTDRCSFDRGVRWLYKGRGESWWVAESAHGVARISIDSLTCAITSKSEYKAPDHFVSDLRLFIDVQDSNVLVSDRLGNVYRYKRDCDCFRSYQHIPETDFSPRKVILTGKDHTFHLFDRFLVHHRNNQLRHRFPLDLAEGSEGVIPLEDSLFFLCFDQGYGLFADIDEHKDKVIPHPHISNMEIYDKRGDLIRKIEFPAFQSEDISLPNHTARLRFNCGTNVYTSIPHYSYRLIGFEEDWSSWDRASYQEYTNLSAGTYKFEFRSDQNEKKAALQFTMQPKWFETHLARFAAFAIFCSLIYLTYHLYQLRIQRHKRRLKIEHQRLLNRQLLMMRAEKLEQDVLIKTKELANSTMSLVQKNEVLTSILGSLKEVKKGLGSRFPDKYYADLVKMINRNLSESEDWTLFETHFNQVHDDFFSGVMRDHPQLTPGELKLAAYLKMNLSSKEIAQLLKISVRGVENKRYRLRKKMNLGAEENLVSFLMHY